MYKTPLEALTSIKETCLFQTPNLNYTLDVSLSPPIDQSVEDVDTTISKTRMVCCNQQNVLNTPLISLNCVFRPSATDDALIYFINVKMRFPLLVIAIVIYLKSVFDFQFAVIQRYVYWFLFV